jgi:glutamate--cysteine ligase
MYFISRGGQYKDVSHMTFSQYLEKKPYGDVYMSDWLLHLTTTFPEVRLKDHLEFRSVDSSTLTFVMAAGAFIKGIMYNQRALDQLEETYASIRAADIHQAIANVAREGMQTKFLDQPIKNQLPSLFELALDGLPSDEHIYLLPMKHYIDQGISPAEEKIQTLDFDDPHVWKNF